MGIALDPLADPDVKRVLAFARARETYPGIPRGLLLDYCQAAWEAATAEGAGGDVLERFERALSLVSWRHRTSGGKLHLRELVDHVIPQVALEPFMSEDDGRAEAPADPEPARSPEPPRHSVPAPPRRLLPRLPFASPVPVGAAVAASMLSLAALGQAKVLPFNPLPPSGGEEEGGDEDSGSVAGSLAAAGGSGGTAAGPSASSSSDVRTARAAAASGGGPTFTAGGVPATPSVPSAGHLGGAPAPASAGPTAPAPPPAPAQAPVESSEPADVPVEAVLHDEESLPPGLERKRPAPPEVDTPEPVEEVEDTVSDLAPEVPAGGKDHGNKHEEEQAPPAVEPAPAVEAPVETPAPAPPAPATAPSAAPPAAAPAPAQQGAPAGGQGQQAEPGGQQQGQQGPAGP